MVGVLSNWYQSMTLGKHRAMAQQKFDERMEAMDQEVSEIRVEIQKLPGIEETLISLSKSIEKLGVQAEKQQIMLTTIAMDLARGQKVAARKD